MFSTNKKLLVWTPCHLRLNVPIGLGDQTVLEFCPRRRKGLEEFIDTTFNTTKEFYQLLDAHPNFSVPYSPQSNILCFQYLPLAHDNEKQMALRYALIEHGNFYITSCEVRGQFRYLRRYS